MSVNRYEVTLEDVRNSNYYKVLVSTVDEVQAIKIAKRKAMENYHLARNNILCHSCEVVRKQK